MTKKKLRLLQESLDEMIEEQGRNFAEDCSIEYDEVPAEFARLAKKYLGRELPKLGETQRDEPPKRRSCARDSADVAREFEESCRALRLALQRGEK